MRAIIDGTQNTSMPEFDENHPYNRIAPLYLDLGEMKKLSGLSMYASKMFGTDFFPTDFQIQVSRDNNTWASIGSEWGYTPP